MLLPSLGFPLGHGTQTDTQAFYGQMQGAANQTNEYMWRKPVDPRFKWAMIICLGAGGGGGGGRRGAAATLRCGGGGGGGGNLAIALLPLSYLNSEHRITVGVGGTPAVATAVDSTDGSIGSSGGTTQFGARRADGAVTGLVSAGGGTGGSGGTGAAGGAGGVASGTLLASFPLLTAKGTAGGAGSSTGGVGVAASPNTTSLTVSGGDIVGGASGGGAGGGVTAANVAANGGAGSASMPEYTNVNGGTGGASGATTIGPRGVPITPYGLAQTSLGLAYVDPKTGEFFPSRGSGGGGGGGSTATTAGDSAGGAGGFWGAGGGGAGGTTNGALPGGAGAGASGFCLVICF